MLSQALISKNSSESLETSQTRSYVLWNRGRKKKKYDLSLLPQNPLKNSSFANYNHVLEIINILFPFHYYANNTKH